MKSSQEILGNENSLIENASTNEPGNIVYKTPSLTVGKNLPQSRLYYLI
jgi:hypothetical protein